MTATYPRLSREATATATPASRLRALAGHKAVGVQRAATRHASLPPDLWRDRLLTGWPEAWDSPQTLMGLLIWTRQDGDTLTPLDGARAASLALLKEPDRSGPEGRGLIAQQIAVWWQSETDARELLRYLGQRPAIAGDGSPEHRRVTLLACLCARTAPALPAESARALDLVEMWALGGEDRRKETRKIAADAAYAASAAAAYAAYAAHAASAAAYAAHAAAYAAYAAHAARTRHPADLADLIRAAVPEVSL